MTSDSVRLRAARPILTSGLAGLCAALLTALVVALFLRAHALPRVAWLTTPVALAAGVSVALFARRGWRSVRIVDLAALVIGTACVAALVPPVAQHYPKVSVSATGQKNPASASSEVWVGLESGAQSFDGHWSGAGDAWEPRGQRYVSYRNQPATLTWDGAWGEGARLELGRHSWSGIARVDIGGKEQTLDLYATVASTLTIPLPRPSLSWKDKALWVGFAAAAMLAVSVFGHLLRALPVVWSGSLAIAFLMSCITLFVVHERSYAGDFDVVTFDSNAPVTTVELDAGQGFAPELNYPLKPSTPSRFETAASPDAAWRIEATDSTLIGIPLASSQPNGPETGNDRVQPVSVGRTSIYTLEGSKNPTLAVVGPDSQKHAIAIPQSGSDKIFVLVERDATSLRVAVSRSFGSLAIGSDFSGDVTKVRILADNGRAAGKLFRISFDAPFQAFELQPAGNDTYAVTSIRRPDSRMFVAIKLLAAAETFLLVMLIPVAVWTCRSLAQLAKSGRPVSVIIGTVGIVGWMGVAALITWPGVVGWDGTMPYVVFDAGAYDTWYGIGYPLLVGGLLLLEGPRLVTATGVAGTMLLLLVTLTIGLGATRRGIRALIVTLCVAWLPLTIIPFASAVHLRDAMNGLVMASFAVCVFVMLMKWSGWSASQRSVIVAALVCNGLVAALLRVDNIPTLGIWFAGACLLLSGSRARRVAMVAIAAVAWLSITPLAERALFPDRAALSAAKRMYGTTALVNPVTGMLKIGQNQLSASTSAQTREVLDRLIDVDFSLAHWSPYEIVYWHQTHTERAPPTDADIRDLQKTYVRLALENPVLFIKIRLATFASNLGFSGSVDGLRMPSNSFEFQSFYDQLTDPGGSMKKFQWLYSFAPEGHHWIDSLRSLRHWTATVATHIPQLIVCLVALAWFRRYPPCAVLAAGTIARVCVFFLFAPASVFLYLYDLQLIGFCLPFLMAGWTPQPGSPATRLSGDA